MGKKTANVYLPENLEFLAKSLVKLKFAPEADSFTSIDFIGLQKALKMLSRKDREKIEHFWGLTGGINHSKRLASLNTKDIAFISMSNDAINSLSNLFRLDYLYLYDKKLKSMVDFLATKINKHGLNISDVDAIKYLLIFLVIFQNGPKMVFENDPMSIDTEHSSNLIFDEYSIIANSFKDFKNLPEHSVDILIIKSMLEMLDYADTLVLRKTFGIPIPKDDLSEKFDDKDITPIYSFGQIRNFKERVFAFGSWDISCELITGNQAVVSQFQTFLNSLNSVRNDWSNMADFKVGQKKLRTLHELRTLDVYNIGGFEFTDIYEVMFLYLTRSIVNLAN